MRTKTLISAAAILSLAALFASCGGGGGGGEGATLTSITVTPTNPSIALGASRQFKATGRYSDSSTKDITASVVWDSSDKTKATIDSGGRATSVAVGPTTITASDGGISSTAHAMISAIALPKTGQTKCYNVLNAETSCTGTGQDGEKQAGVAWPGTRFTDNGDGTVTDNLTGLMWLKDANCIKTKYSTFDADGTVAWQSALDFVKGINSGTYVNCRAGHTDWRLPNRRELRSLINFGYNEAMCGASACTGSAAWLNTQGFINVPTPNAAYWSSTTDVSSKSDAWVYDTLTYDSINTGTKGGGSASVWPVRTSLGAGASPARPFTSGQKVCYNSVGTAVACTGTGQDGERQEGTSWSNPRFIDNKNGTVTDNLTGLIWLRDADCMFGAQNNYRSWADALKAANGLKSGDCGLTDNSNAGDWRLPNVTELESLVHAGYNEATCSGSACSTNAAWLNTQGFGNIQSFGYWSSTTTPRVTSLARYVSMRDGLEYSDTKDFLRTFYVWPVRGGE